MGTTAVLLQAGLTVAMLGLLVLAGRLTDAVLCGDPRLPRPGNRAVAPGETEGGDMIVESQVRQLMADRMREAADHRRGAPRSGHRQRRSSALRRKVGYGLVRAGLRLSGTPVPISTGQGARP